MAKVETYFVGPGKKIPLFDWTEEILLKQDFDEEIAKDILDSSREQLNNITICITYEDILGKPQKPLNYTIVPPG
jgi:hypothetical protein